MECIALGHGRKMICRGMPRLAILYAFLLMTVWLDASMNMQRNGDWESGTIQKPTKNIARISLLSHIHMQAFPVPLPLQVQGTSAELPHLSSFQFSWQVTGDFPYIVDSGAY